MEVQCTKCFYLFWDEIQIDGTIETTYRCGKPVGTAAAKRLPAGGIDHDVVTIIKKSSKDVLPDDDTIIAPDWCEGFRQEPD